MSEIIKNTNHIIDQKLAEAGAVISDRFRIGYISNTNSVKHILKYRRAHKVLKNLRNNRYYENDLNLVKKLINAL